MLTTKARSSFFGNKTIKVCGFRRKDGCSWRCQSCQLQACRGPSSTKQWVKTHIPHREWETVGPKPETILGLFFAFKVSYFHTPSVTLNLSSWNSFCENNILFNLFKRIQFKKKWALSHSEETPCAPALPEEPEDFINALHPPCLGGWSVHQLAFFKRVKLLFPEECGSLNRSH